jgi:hypothetical protein
VKLVDRRAALVFAGAVALLAGGYFAFRPTDESRIRSQLDKLAAALRITDADMQTNAIGRLAHVSGIFATLFDPDVRASVPELASLGSGRRGLEEVVTGAPRFVRTVEVDFSAITVKLDDAATSAAVGATAHVVALDREGRTHDERRAVDFRFVKQDGDWLIATVTVWSNEDARPE